MQIDFFFTVNGASAIECNYFLVEIKVIDKVIDGYILHSNRALESLLRLQLGSGTDLEIKIKT